MTNAWGGAAPRRSPVSGTIIGRARAKRSQRIYDRWTAPASARRPLRADRYVDRGDLVALVKDHRHAEVAGPPADAGSGVVRAGEPAGERVAVADPDDLPDG